MTTTITAPPPAVAPSAGPVGIPADGSPTQRAGALLDLLAERAATQARDDLVAAARRAHRTVEGAWFRVAVMGEFKTGKSSLVNALVDAPVCAVDDDVTSPAPVEVGFSEQCVARAWVADHDGRPHGREVGFDDVAEVSIRADTTLVRAGLPRRLLEPGLVLIDTPGVGGMTSAMAAVTASTLADAHAVLFVTDASQEMTAPEMEALVDADRRCGRVLVVETKTDVCPHWRTILATDRSHLAAHGLTVPVIGVSNEIRRMALAADDATLNDESGFPALIEVIARDLSASARRIMVEGALAEARRILVHLRMPLVHEREALTRDESDPDPVTTAEGALVRLRKQTASWQQVLGDGMSDLSATVDSNLRNGFRALLREVETTIDEVDPELAWGELEPVIHRRVAETVDANLSLLRAQAETLAARLVELVDESEPTPVELWTQSDRDETDDPTVTRRTSGPPTARLAYGNFGDDAGKGRVHHAFRAGYGGAMPVMVIGGMALGVLGLGTLVLPLAGVAGAFAGRRAIGDDRSRQLRQRRQEAKAVVRTHLDEVCYRASVEHKAAQRRVQRVVRDHIGRRIADTTASRERSVLQARRAVETGEASRRARLEVIDRELIRLDVLSRAVDRVVAT
ncbi:MAG TPA: dynamin family protein [Acidimicrobiales bacterium]|nr:dynamin family protein [Acidimicrobiales bacterium]